MSSLHKLIQPWFKGIQPYAERGLCLHTHTHTLWTGNNYPSKFRLEDIIYGRRVLRAFSPAVVDFPTPPLPEATAIIFFTLGKSNFPTLRPAFIAMLLHPHHPGIVTQKELAHRTSHCGSCLFTLQALYDVAYCNTVLCVRQVIDMFSITPEAYFK
jgi:hypothetical protein